MPDKSVFVSQIFFGSIGWATGTSFIRFMSGAVSDDLLQLALSEQLSQPATRVSGGRSCSLVMVACTWLIDRV